MCIVRIYKQALAECMFWNEELFPPMLRKNHSMMMRRKLKHSNDPQLDSQLKPAICTLSHEQPLVARSCSYRGGGTSRRRRRRRAYGAALTCKYLKRCKLTQSDWWAMTQTPMLAVVLCRSQSRSTASSLPRGPSWAFSSWARLTSYGVSSLIGALQPGGRSGFK